MPPKTRTLNASPSNGADRPRGLSLEEVEKLDYGQPAHPQRQDSNPSMASAAVSGIYCYSVVDDFGGVSAYDYKGFLQDYGSGNALTNALNNKRDDVGSGDRRDSRPVQSSFFAD